MKSILKITVITGCILLAACARKQPSAEELLKDDKTRDEIMTAICNDSNMTERMINYMSTTGASKKMLPFTCQILGKIMSSEVMKRDTAVQNSVISGMLHIIATDSNLCDKTCVQMSETPSIEKIMERNSKTYILEHPIEKKE